jgi:hypothetical protein
MDGPDVEESVSITVTDPDESEPADDSDDSEKE